MNIRHKYSTYKMICWLMVGIGLMTLSIVSALWVSRDEYMTHYSTTFISNFPQSVDRRVLMNQWCNALMSQTVRSSTWAIISEQLSGRTYSWAYRSPQQSTIAYILCSPFIRSNQFDVRTRSIVTSVDYEDIIPNITPECNIQRRWNNLWWCDIHQLYTDITVMVLNDLSNIRLGVAWGYISDNPTEIIRSLTTRFGQWSGNNLSKYIDSINLTLCSSPSINYLGPNQTQQCGFPLTNSYIINNAQNYGKWLVNKTRIIDGNRALRLECDITQTQNNIIWCGITNSISTQNFIDMMYNELWVYEQFVAMYTSMAQITNSIVVGNNAADATRTQQLLTALIDRSEYNLQAMKQATQRSIQLISQMEWYYPLHLWLTLVYERSKQAIGNYIIPSQINSSNYLIDRLNTQTKE